MASSPTPPPAKSKSVFAAAPTQPPTVIFELTRRYAADAHPQRVNLGVGAYRDARLAPVVFSAVRRAEAQVVAANSNKEYLPIAGLPDFRAGAAALLLGEDCAALREGRVATVQTLSGTGSLTVGAVLLRRLLPRARIFCSDPTWENHGKVVADAGAGGPGGLEHYRYYDASGRCLDEEGLLADLGAMPEGSVVLLHACAHNPTGVDPSRAQWGLVLEACRRRRLLPWFDIAYQGFASGDPSEDAWAVREFARAGLEMLISQSFAKNMGLYCERVGALHFVAADRASASAVLSNVEAIVRPMYSNPPAHGARIVAQVLGSAELRKVRVEWGRGAGVTSAQEAAGPIARATLTRPRTRTHSHALAHATLPPPK
jgi:aspartate/tyrosine/aromatic aminotransferase